MDRSEFLRWAANELSVRHPGHAVDEGNDSRAVRCARNMYLAVDAPGDGEIRVHIFTDRAQLMLTTAAPVLLLPPSGMTYAVKRGGEPAERLSARLTWRHLEDSYAGAKEQALVALNWLRELVIPNLLPD